MFHSFGNGPIEDGHAGWNFMDLDGDMACDYTKCFLHALSVMLRQMG